MKAISYSILSSIGLFGLLITSSCSSPEIAHIQQVSTSPGQSDGSLADRIHRDVNSYRASKGRAALARHKGLDAIAQKHCNRLAAKIGNKELDRKDANHEGFEGRSLIALRVYRIPTLGENVVTSANHSSKHLVDLWSKSKNHDFNMCSDWTYTGIGTATTPGGLVVSTQVFGTAPVSARDAAASRYGQGF